MKILKLQLEAINNHLQRINNFTHYQIKINYGTL